MDPQTQLTATTQEVREWAERKGIELPARGKLPTKVRTQFEEETGMRILPSSRTIERNLARGQSLTEQAQEVIQAPLPIEEEQEPEWMVRGRERAQLRAQERMRVVEV